MAQKPWMKKRANETTAEYHARLNRTCYGCGKDCGSMAAADEHEKTCKKIAQVGRKKKS